MLKLINNTDANNLFLELAIKEKSLQKNEKRKNMHNMLQNSVHQNEGEHRNRVYFNESYPDTILDIVKFASKLDDFIELDNQAYACLEPLRDFVNSLYTTSSNGQMSLDHSKVAYAEMKNIKLVQPREEDLDFAHAKGLAIKLDSQDDGAINCLPFAFRKKNKDGSGYTLWILIGNHRYKKCELLGALSMPVITIPQSISDKIPEAILCDVGRAENATRHKKKDASLRDNVNTSYNALQTILDTHLRTKLHIKDVSEREGIIEEIFNNDRTLFKEEYPEIYKRWYKFLRTLSGAPGLIAGGVWNKIEDKDRNYINGKSGAVLEKLKLLQGDDAPKAKKANEPLWNIPEISSVRFRVTLLDGEQQQDQGKDRLRRKRWENPEATTYGLLSPTGNSSSVVFRRRKKILEHLLEDIVILGEEAGTAVLESAYSDGFLTFPNFTSGFKGEILDIGGKHYVFDCQPEDHCNPEHWRHFELSEVISFLKWHAKVHPKEITLQCEPKHFEKFILPVAGHFRPV